MDRKLLDIVCCPVTRSSLELLSQRELDTLNQLIEAKRIRNREDAVVDGEVIVAVGQADQEDGSSSGRILVAR